MAKKPYDSWRNKFVKRLEKEVELDVLANVDDNVKYGYTKPELKWKPLSPKYKARKIAQGKNLKGLIFNNNLFKATQSKSQIKNNKVILVKIYNNLRYSGMHEKNGRPFIAPAINETLKPKNIRKLALIAGRKTK